MTVEAIVPHHSPEEAREHERAFLDNLAGAQDHYEWIVERRAWNDLGFETFAGWWEGRIQPVMRALSMRPTREIAAKVVERIRAEEAELPPAQRRRERELAELVGTKRDEVRHRQERSTSGGIPPKDDLAATPTAGPPSAPPPASPKAEPIPAGDEHAEAQGSDARLDAQLDAEMERTAARFRSNFAKAIASADDVWQFDLDRIADLYAASYERDLQPFLDEMTAWCGRVSNACKRRRSGLRLVPRGER